MGFTALSFYCASKFAVEGYSEALATEVGPLGIHITLVEPGGFRSDFAGPSLVTAVNDDSDYAPVNQHIAGYVRSRHGNQENDPGKFGPAMCALVDAEKPPLRLPLGKACIASMRANLQTVSEEIDHWEALSLSTMVEG
ncbi:short chain dehydrogenase [compost metagenome]